MSMPPRRRIIEIAQSAAPEDQVRSGTAREIPQRSPGETDITASQIVLMVRGENTNTEYPVACDSKSRRIIRRLDADAVRTVDGNECYLSLAERRCLDIYGTLPNLADMRRQIDSEDNPAKCAGPGKGAPNRAIYWVGHNLKGGEVVQVPVVYDLKQERFVTTLRDDLQREKDAHFANLMRDFQSANGFAVDAWGLQEMKDQIVGNRSDLLSDRYSGPSQGLSLHRVFYDDTAIAAVYSARAERIETFEDPKLAEAGKTTPPAQSAPVIETRRDTRQVTATSTASRRTHS